MNEIFGEQIHNDDFMRWICIRLNIRSFKFLISYKTPLYLTKWRRNKYADRVNAWSVECGIRS